jgi:hypothetical protein
VEGEIEKLSGGAPDAANTTKFGSKLASPEASSITVAGLQVTVGAGAARGSPVTGVAIVANQAGEPKAVHAPLKQVPKKVLAKINGTVPPPAVSGVKNLSVRCL